MRLTKLVPLGPLALLTFALATPAFAQLQAPNAKATVAAVRMAHPEIDSCDDVSLDKGRAAIVDWTAQRLNAHDPAARWGRKGSTSTGLVKNTDALTFKRNDGKFEIYDVVGGSAPCNATWQAPTRALSPGENGWWAPPQLGPEPSATPTGPTPTPTPTPTTATAATADLQQQQLQALLQIVTTLQQQNAALVAAINDLKAQVAAGVRVRF